MALYRTKLGTHRESMRLPDVCDINGRLAFDDWVRENKGRNDRCRYRGDTMQITNPRAFVTAFPGDWIVATPDGLVSLNPPAFEATFERVHPAPLQRTRSCPSEPSLSSS